MHQNWKILWLKNDPVFDPILDPVLDPVLDPIFEPKKSYFGVMIFNDYEWGIFRLNYDFWTKNLVDI